MSSKLLEFELLNFLHRPSNYRFIITISREIIHHKQFNCGGFGLYVIEMPVNFHVLLFFCLSPSHNDITFKRFGNQPNGYYLFI